MKTLLRLRVEWDIVGIAVMVFQVHGMHLEKLLKTMLVVMKKFIEELLAQ